MSRAQFDLHLHSYYSDGDSSPDVILKRVKRARFRLCAITDHNTTEHIPKALAAAKKLNQPILTGIELGVEFKNHELHLLGYCFNQQDKQLSQALKTYQRNRKNTLKRIANNLKNQGFVLNAEDLDKERADYLGLFHIVKLLKKNRKNLQKIDKEVKSRDVFPIINAYLRKGNPAFIKESHLTARHAIQLVKKAGGFVVLAHPGFHLSSKENNIIIALKKLGLEGLEVFTPKHNWEQIKRYETLASKLDLVVTAGSDYHEIIHNKKIPLATPLGLLQTPPQILENLLQFLRRKGKKIY